MLSDSAGYLVRDVSLADGRVVDLRLADGRITDLSPAGGPDRPDDAGWRAVPAAGLLALPAFVDIHAHLDKAYTRDDLADHDGTLPAAIRAMSERKKRFTPEDVAERAGRLILSGVAEGVTHVRTHVDVDSITGLRGLEGVSRAAEACRDVCLVSIVAFPQLGIRSDPGALDLMQAAVEAGAGVVGGMPHWEATREDQLAHVEALFDLAERHDLDVDMHVDESDDASVRTLEMVAEATISRGWQGRVTAGHVCSLAAADDDYASRVIAKCAEAALTIVSNPATNLVIQGRGDRGLVRRGLTRIGEFRAAGVNVCLGQDNVCDGFYPFGRGSMLEVAFLGAHAAHLTRGDDLAYLLETVTSAPARAWRDAEYGLRAGSSADLNLFRAPSWVEALRLQRPPELVFFKGRPVASAAMSGAVGVGRALDGLLRVPVEPHSQA
jgi:cytosine/creatinine deaminase